MSQDRQHHLSREHQYRDIQAGLNPPQLKLPDTEGGIDSKRDLVAAQVRELLDDYWNTNLQDSALEPAEIKAQATIEHPYFQSSEEMYAYYRRQADLTQAVDSVLEDLSQTTSAERGSLDHTPDIESDVHGQPSRVDLPSYLNELAEGSDATGEFDGNTPALDIEPGKAAPAGFRQDDDDSSFNHEVTRIESLRQRVSVKMWKKLSVMTHKLIDGLISNRHGKEWIDNVQYRQAEAALMIAEMSELGKLYHQWLVDKVGQELRAKYPDISDEQIIETCRVLIIQEAGSDIYD